MHDERRDDTPLVRRIELGDVGALKEAFDNYGTVLLRAAMRITGDSAIAEEVVQDVFVKLWRNAATYSPDRGPVAAWLMVTCRGKSIDALRRRDARQRREVAHGRDSTSAGVTPGDGDARQQRVRDAVNRLPTAQRRVVELAYYGGLTYRATAAALGIPEGTAKSQLRAALASLHASLVADAA